MKETEAINPPDEGNNPCIDTGLPPGYIDPPARFLEVGSESRLIPQLRRAAATQNPNRILARAALAFFRAQHPTAVSSPQADMELGNALADLAVTGRVAYTAFQNPLLIEELSVRILVTRALPSTVGHSEVESAISLALDRAFRVAWALRGPVAQRAGLRDPLEWIAVSGEDDTPHRPVNVPSPPFEQYDIQVTVTPRTMVEPVMVKTRFFIASAVEDTAPVGIIPLSRTLPPDPVPRVPDGHQVILFLHGHSSSADEALPIIPEILKAGLARGVKYSIISFDLPNSAYSEMFDHKRAALSSATTYPGGWFDRQQIRTPILDFEEDFVVAFVNALDDITPIKNRFAGVIGGSLGGNLGLRLGRRPDLAANSWLGAGIVSWSPASVWEPFVQNEILRKGPDLSRSLWDLPETSLSRADYFATVFDRFIDDVWVRTKQPQYWYSNDWTPCKQLVIEGARIARRETYSANFRQWHWRLGAEQLIYSHVDRVNHFDENTPRRYEQNTVRQLLAAGADDNHQGIRIFNNTRTLSNLMVNTPGESLFLLRTGHSMHIERPAFLAGEIVKFLFTPTVRQSTDISYLVPLLLSEPATTDVSYLVPLLLNEPV
jgi:pimeloyl-ACP methyl ester carboxylesterase